MYKGKTIAVVVPAYNEEDFIADVIRGIPEFVDRIYVVNDASTDNTAKIAQSFVSRNDKIKLINHQENGGVGAAITSGHLEALEKTIDIVTVMAGDNQMPPEYMPALLDPIVEGEADYAKGDRMSHSQHRKEMPKFRRLGTFLLTILTRISSGYWHIKDPQNGYTAISNKALSKISLNELYEGFAFENDMLIRLNLINARVVDVPHPAVYRGQVSKINYPKFIISTSWMLLKSWMWRIWKKYITRQHS